MGFYDVLEVQNAMAEMTALMVATWLGIDPKLGPLAMQFFDPGNGGCYEC